MNERERMNALGGTLIRRGADKWEWCDDTPAPTVRDLRPSLFYNFSVSSGGRFVEVPVSATRRDANLSWVARGIRGVAVQTGKVAPDLGTSELAPEVYLVPIEVWEQWN